MSRSASVPGIVIGVVLALLMAITRGVHAAPLNMLPEASWAVFFLAGVFLRPAWVLPLLLIEAALLDFAAINFQNVSSFCMSPAYIALIPAYGALWLVGRWFSGKLDVSVKGIALLAAAVIGSAAIAELISSGSFYFFSGRFSDTSLAGFAPRFVKYFPGNIGAMALYVGIAAVIQLIASEWRALIAGNPAKVR